MAAGASIFTSFAKLFVSQSGLGAEVKPVLDAITAFEAQERIVLLATNMLELRERDIITAIDKLASANGVAVKPPK